MLPGPVALAKDVMVKVLSENYKETRVESSHTPLIYHSFQISSSAGSKVIVLQGDDATYRKWLRSYLASTNHFLLRIDAGRNDEFVSSKAFYIDVKQVHPVRQDKWVPMEINETQEMPIEGANYILVVDSHKKRSGLIRAVIERMGYRADIHPNSETAVAAFRLYPDKFRMILAHHESIQPKENNFVDQIIETDPGIPLVLDTGYQNSGAKQIYTARFSNNPSVIIKPVILNELSKTISRLVRKDA